MHTPISSYAHTANRAYEDIETCIVVIIPSVHIYLQHRLHKLHVFVI